MSDYKLPPIGVTPKYVTDAERAGELCGAICRYVDSNYPVEAEWMNELREIVLYHNNMCCRLKEQKNTDARKIVDNTLY